MRENTCMTCYGIDDKMVDCDNCLGFGYEPSDWKLTESTEMLEMRKLLESVAKYGILGENF